MIQFAEDDDDLEVSERYRAARAYVLILGMLSRYRWVTAKEVHQRLHEAGWAYDVRTVQGLLKSMAADQEGVERDASAKPFRYRWQPDLANPWNPELVDREALILLLATQHLRQLVPVEVLGWLDGRFEEARRRLAPGSGARPLANWLQKVAVVSQLPRLQPPAIDPDVLVSVTQALLNDTWLNVDYRNAAGQTLGNRRVMPLALVQQGERLFLVCRFDGYQDVRNLALHRISRAEVTPHRFECSGFDLDQYIRDGGFGFSNGERIELQLSVAHHLAELLAETPLAPDQRIEPESESRMRVTANVLRGEQMRWWIRMHGDAVKLISPSNFLTEVDSAQPARTAIK